MRPRPPPATLPLPERLVRHVPSEWSGRTPSERFGAWADARHSYDDAHPDQLAVDFVELLRYELAERRRVNGWST